ncbi:MAG: co-chaperone GroES [Parachlamydiaceae bacterium]|nr:co-chaperone GroES [Parachlamydiaceae bacterium]
MSQTQQMNQPKSCCVKPATKLLPLGNRVLVSRLEPETKLKGGIVLPDSAKKKQEQAKVIAIGTGKKDKSGNLIPMPVKVDDIILMEKYSGQEITINDEEFIIIKAEDIIAVIEI